MPKSEHGDLVYQSMENVPDNGFLESTAPHGSRFSATKSVPSARARNELRRWEQILAAQFVFRV